MKRHKQLPVVGAIHDAYWPEKRQQIHLIKHQNYITMTGNNANCNVS